MSITDPVLIDTWHDLFILVQGRETFYDEDNCMITFDTTEEAEEWAVENLGKQPKISPHMQPKLL